MNIELGVMNDGCVMMVSDRPLPHILKRIEFYRDQRLMMLVYHNKDKTSELMEYEISMDLTNHIEQTPNILVYSLYPDHDPIGYKVPLVKVGDLY